MRTLLKMSRLGKLLLTFSRVKANDLALYFGLRFVREGG